MSIEQQIAAALAGRAAQVEFVDGLSDSWEHLRGTWAGLVMAAGDLGVSAAGARSPDRTEAGLFSDLARYLAADAPWGERAGAVSARMGEATGLVRTLQQRVHRKTVNIGVIGQTHAGKSTLLRKLTGLDVEHIPSNRFSSTTATPSRIFHEPGSEPGRAVLTLHTWESFRAELLVPLHDLARIPGPPPASLEEFRRFPGYRDDTIQEGHAGAERYRRRLRLAQDSLPSYADLLRGGVQEITLDRLRPFVAYPRDDDPRPDYRPYHAVRSVDIFCAFPEVGAVALGLVDLPGAGEAGLDVHGRFLTDLRNHADVLFIVKRPETAPVTDPDWDARQLADEAAAGVRRSDFAHQVINRDSRVPEEFFANALKQTGADSEQLGIDVRVCDIESSSPAVVAEAILSPLLAMLAERLAYMDRDAAEKVLSDLTGITTEMQSLAGELEHWIEGRQGGLPDEENRLRNRAYELKNEVSWELKRVRDDYDKLYESGAPIAELHEEIEKAGREMQDWLAGGLGTGSRQEWLRTFRNAEAAHGHGRELDQRYNGARKHVVAVFGGIDASLARSVDRLWGEVADALRTKLKDVIVPTEPDNRAILTAFMDTARRGGARTLGEATHRLLNLPTDYGSIFLRVGRPIIRKIDWDQEEGGSQLGSTVAAAAGAGAAAAASAGVSAVIGPALGAAAQQLAQGAVGEAVSAGVREGMRRAPWRTQSAGNQPAGSPGGWWQATPGAEASHQPPAPPASPSAGLAAARPAGPDGAAPGTGESDRAARWYAELTSTVEQVTGELTEEFHKEAQRTLRVLAAAVDLFKDAATSTPGVESEFEKLCRPVQRQIWPDDFGGAAAKVAADLAGLRQRAVEADGAAAQVASLAGKARRL
jgi:hypothetical protein